MAEGRIRLQPPFGGLNKRAGFQDQAPYTSPDCMNVWPRDPLRFRTRLGSRPGLLRGPVETEGIISNPIAFIDSLDVADAYSLVHYVDSFNGTALSSNVWDAVDGGTICDISTVAGQTYASATYSGTAQTRSAMWKIPSNFDTTYPVFKGASIYKMDVGIFLVPYKGRHWGKYRLFLESDATTPDPYDEGIVVEIDFTSTTYAASVTSYTSGVPTSEGTFSLTDNGNAGWLSVVLFKNGAGSGVDSLFVFWKGRLIIDVNGLTYNEHRIGFGLVAEDTATIDGETVNGKCLVDRFRCTYRRSDEVNNIRTVFVVGAERSGSGYLYSDTTSTLIEPVNDSDSAAMDGAKENISIDQTLETAEFLQTLLIADHGEVIASGDAGTFISSAHFEDDDISAGSGWEAEVSGLDIYNYTLRVDGYGDYSINDLSYDSGSGSDVDQLGIIETWGFATGTSFPVGGGAGSGTLTWRIFRSPKRYVYTNGQNLLARWRANSGKGLIPCNNRLVCRWSERVVLAGDPENPNIWYMSRQGDQHDYDLAAADGDGSGGGALASTSAGQGVIGEPITALIPATDDYLYFGCTKSIYAMSGDPGFGGNYDNVSREIGIVGARAWTQTPDGVIVFMSQDGLYVMGPGSRPQSISREVMPQELLDIDPQQYHVILQYDLRFRGVWIFLTNKDAVATTHYWLDWETKTYWPFQLASTDMDPFSVLYYKAKNYEDQRTYLGCRDGNIRTFHLLAPDDDGSAFLDNTYADIGPISCGGIERDGVVTEISGALDSESGEVDWSIKPGETPEESITATAQETGEWIAGQNTVEHPRVRAETVTIRVAGGSTNRPWAIERMNMEIKPAGRQRL